MPIRSLIAITMLILSFTMPAEGQQASAAPAYNLEVSFDIPNSKVMGVAKVPVQAKQELRLATGELRIIQVSLNDKRIDTAAKDGSMTVLPSESGILAIAYEGVFKSTGAGDGRNYGVTPNLIDGRGISLTGAWYPQPEALSVYSLSATLPHGYEAVSEAESISITKTEAGTNTIFTFLFPHPLDGIHLIATDRYDVLQDTVRGIELSAYFFREDKKLAETYLQHARKYIDLYEKLLTPYPYKRFSIVENFLPTGYSMPTFTLLGQDVVKLPFIVETSLGHEILHQWFGNSVYIDFEKGNWAEGLTTYLADHLYEEQKGRGWEYRKQMLVDYESYVNEKNELSLRAFRERTDFASKAIGYGKGAMVFHMLKNMMGEDGFYQALKNVIAEKRFQRASWDDFERECGKAAKKDLRWFFKQWVEEKGMPSLRLGDVDLLQSGDKYEVKFAVVQPSKPYILSLLATDAYLHGGSKTELLTIDKEKDNFDGLLDRIPEKISLDENYDIARRLTREEVPPVIARLLGDEKPIIVLPVNRRDVYTGVVEAFKQRGGVEREAGDVKNSDVKSASLIILGQDNPLIGRLYGAVDMPDAGFSVIMRENPWNPQKVVCIIHAKTREEVVDAVRKIFHYGKYSALTFDRGRNISKKTVESERGITMELREEPQVVDLSTLKTLKKVIEGAAGKKIVYVGEYHDRVSHHNVQLQVLQGLHRKDPKIAVGMEMFQRPFQKALDDYISGSIDEREFLKSSEYFKRWGFDYNLYKPIIDFCREQKIPVVALNISREIVEKVAQKGLDSLSDEEKKEIPPNMDFSDDEYRERLKEIFNRHRGGGERSFDFFYQAQVLWDEIMSQSIDEFLKKNPDRRLVGITGGGHLAYGSGIPKRTFRRNGYEYAVILNDADVEQDIADYIVFPKPLGGVTAPKLNALFTEEHGKVGIANFSDGSISKKAGLKIGDVLLSLDGTSMKSVEDVKLALFFKKKNDILRVKVMRKRFFLGDTEKEFEIKLP